MLAALFAKDSEVVPTGVVVQSSVILCVPPFCPVLSTSISPIKNDGTVTALPPHWADRVDVVGKLAKYGGLFLLCNWNVLDAVERIVAVLSLSRI